MKTLIKALNDQKNRLISNTHFSREDFETIVFSEEDLVEKYLKDNNLSENDVNLEELRDIQRDVLDALDSAAKKINLIESFGDCVDRANYYDLSEMYDLDYISEFAEMNIEDITDREIELANLDRDEEIKITRATISAALDAVQDFFEQKNGFKK